MTNPTCVCTFYTTCLVYQQRLLGCTRSSKNLLTTPPSTRTRPPADHPSQPTLRRSTFSCPSRPLGYRHRSKDPDRRMLGLRTSICGRIRGRGCFRSGLGFLGRCWEGTARWSTERVGIAEKIWGLAKGRRLTLKACPHPAVASNKPSISGCQSINQLESGVSVYQHNLVPMKSFSWARRGKTLLSS